MDIIILLNTVITILKGVHVQGEEAAQFAKAIELLIGCVKTLREIREREEKKHETDDEQGKRVRRRVRHGGDAEGETEAGADDERGNDDGAGGDGV